MKRWIVSALAALIGVFAASAQEAWQGADAQDTREIFEMSVRYITLSPDGTALAGMMSGGVCTYSLTALEETCFPFPEALGGIQGNEIMNPFAWSPDGTEIAMTEDPYILAYESDIWTLDIASGTYTNRTDDDAYGGIFSAERRNAPADVIPAYAPNGDLYFFRFQRIGDESLSDANVTVQRLAPGSDTPEQVADLTGVVPAFGVYYRPVVSPDGSSIVFPVFATEPQSPDNGLWLLDVTTGEARQLTDTSDTLVGMPESVHNVYFVTANPVWAGVGAGVVFQAVSRERSNGQPLQNFLYVDVETGEVTPVIDLTDFPAGADALSVNEEGYSPQLLLPRGGAVSADGSSFVYVRWDHQAELAQLASVALPPDGSDPVVLGEVEFNPLPHVPNPRAGETGTALLGGWLYTFE